MPAIRGRWRGTGMKYEVRWTETKGVEQSRTFRDLSEAEAFAATLPPAPPRNRLGQSAERMAELRAMRRRVRLPLDERIRSKVVIDGAGCWIWQGHIGKEGYGSIGIRVALGVQRMALAHRASYETFVGPIPDGLSIDHLCRVRSCVNPEHLEPVTARENVLRSPIAQAALNAAKTECPQGHPYDEANTYHYRSGRVCRACRAMYSRRYSARRKAS